MKTLQAQGKDYQWCYKWCASSCSIHSGFDDQLARHFAYLFIRDPISLFEEKLQQDPKTEMDHFEVKSNVL